MADNVKTEATKTETSVTDADLAKSITELQSLLESDGTDKPIVPVVKAEEKVAKAEIGTDGGLQAETPSDGDINKEIKPDEQEEDKDPLTSSIKQAKTAPVNITKAITSEEEELTEDFAKSLAAAFSAQEALMEEARENEFAKSLVMSTIEGFSIQHEEMGKALSGLEERQNAKIDVLIKSLVPLMQAVSAIQKEVSDVANAPVRTTPKAAGVIQKSFDTDLNGGKTTLSKAQIAEALERLALAGKLGQNAGQVVAGFESTGYIDPALLAEIQRQSAR